jgi:HD-like signal output (HDOD) protein
MSKFIEHPLPDLDAWVDFFSQAELPVLRHSQTTLEKLRADADTANSRLLGETILQDPLLTLRVLRYLAAHRGKQQTTDITTIDQAIMMIGIQPFFRAFTSLPLVEEQLKPYPRALLGLLKAIQRARHAAHWARNWAVLRRDVDVHEIVLAALLHDLAELCMWLFAPTLALRVRDAQLAHPDQRSADVQTAIYGVPLHQLKLALATAWRLPTLLLQLIDHRQANDPRVRNVKLAVDLARHSADGWNNPALPNDFAAIRELLHINQEALVRQLGLDDATCQQLLAK